jgi:protein-ribulosamine 3-kinase
MPDWIKISKHISAAAHTSFNACDSQRLRGSISTVWRIGDDLSHFFVKLNSPQREEDMFAAEYAGLLELHKAGAIRVPQPVCYGQTAEHSYLVTEYLPLTAPLDSRRMGQQLAQLHRCTAVHYGWQRDNTLGTTPQPNTQCANWLTFWRDQRLQHQFKLAATNGYHGDLQRLSERLLTDLSVFFRDHAPSASLLHGDLWSGNAAALPDGTPVIFDPAVYYGDRETDLAMTELFGGFDADFYAAYREHWPLADGYAVRKNLYNLYHILNHLNLFGGAYLRQAENLLKQLLAETA